MQTSHLALLPRIDPAAGDTAGFGQPFAALVVAKIARAEALRRLRRSDRLMAPVFYIGRRALLSTDGWNACFRSLASRLKESGDAQMQARMLPAVATALKTLD